MTFKQSTEKMRTNNNDDPNVNNSHQTEIIKDNNKLYPSMVIYL